MIRKLVSGKFRLYSRKTDPKTGGRLLDVILDVARQKGTGKWTSQSAMDLQAPIPTIDAAVGMRDLSAYQEERTRAERMASGAKFIEPEDVADAVLYVPT